MIILSQSLENLGKKMVRVVHDGGRLAIKYPDTGWSDLTGFPVAFALGLWGHIHGVEKYLDWEFSIEETDYKLLSKT